MQTVMQIARDLTGTKESKGSADNPKIIEMYRAVGHDWVEHDEVAWCAAFVGFCLEKAGLRSTRKLNARSYLAWGEKVAGVEQAKEGDIVVFTRGASTAQGHVAFFLRVVGTQVEVLGGNQSDAVTVARYARSRIIGIRRPLAAAAPGRPELKVVQQQLKDLGYFEVGNVDGRYGPRTRAAVLAFRADNVLRAESALESSHDVSDCKIAPAASFWSTQIRDKPKARRLPRVMEKISSIANTGSRKRLALTVLNTSF